MIDERDPSTADPELLASEMLGSGIGSFLPADEGCGFLFPEDWAGLTAWRQRAAARLAREREAIHAAFERYPIAAGQPRRGDR